MQITAGKFYRMRNGGKAFVAAVMLPNPFGPSPDCSIHGYAVDGCGKSWRTGGEWRIGMDSQYDLISEWREPATKEVTLYLYRMNNIVNYASSPIENVIGSAKVTLTEGKFA